MKTMTGAQQSGLTARDLVITGIFTALHLVFMMAGGGFFAPNPVLTFLMPAGAALLTGPVYLLLIAKVPKHGPVMVLGAIEAIVIFVTGMYWLWAVALFALGIVADLIAGAGDFRNRSLNLLSFVVFSLNPLGSYLMLWITPAAYSEYLTGRGSSQDYMATMTATGTGWVNPIAALSLELLYDGDTAIAAAQYSYLPSGVQFIADTDKARASGKTLVTAIVAWWKTLPEGDRPRLLLYGESMGVLAGEAAFDDLAGVLKSVDGVLWVGPPNSSRLWHDLVTRRDPGTREADPTYSAGMTVRFAQDSSQLQSFVGDDTWTVADPVAPSRPGADTVYHYVLRAENGTDVDAAAAASAVVFWATRGIGA